MLHAGEMQVVGPDSRALCFRSWPLALSPLPEAMRSGRACSALASLLLLWLGVAAAQKASSWKTLSGEASMLLFSLYIFFGIYAYAYENMMSFLSPK